MLVNKHISNECQNEISDQILDKANSIQLLLTDCDGVLTDGGVYYSARGEEMKRFSLRDGMGVERLRKLTGIETGIITGENTELLKRRTEKLNITEYHPGIKDKLIRFKEIITRLQLSSEEVAYIGDDVNDLEIIKTVGLSACPSDAMPSVRSSVTIVLQNKGGYGAFREFAELIIQSKLKKSLL